jgi:hypothetical protein
MLGMKARFQILLYSFRVPARGPTCESCLLERQSAQTGRPERDPVMNLAVEIMEMYLYRTSFYENVLFADSCSQSRDIIETRVKRKVTMLCVSNEIISVMQS